MKDNKKYLSSKEFADLCGITKNTLIWYEKKGLLKPKLIGENGYHYYSREQFYDIDLIKSLKWTDRSLDECRFYMDHRSEENFLAMLIEQQNLLEKKITHLTRQRNIVDRSIQDYLSMKSRFSVYPQLIALPEMYFLVKEVTELTPKDYIETLSDLFQIFHSCLKTYGSAPGMFNGAIISRENLLKGNYTVLSYLTLKINAPIPIDACHTMEKGYYATCFHTGDIGKIAETYERLKDFIARIGFEISGDSLENDFINYLHTDDPERFCKEILIPVRKMRSNAAEA